MDTGSKYEGHQAYSFLLPSEQKYNPSEQKFVGKIFSLKYSSYLNQMLNRWANDAGIQTKISFHCFRHSMACIQLEAGTDIYTVSKMLGHRDLKTTQIYAKIVDKTKREASERVII